MSYIQPENSNRVNSIKEKFESSLDRRDSSTDKKYPTNEKAKETLCRTLSASPITPRKCLKLNVTRQLSNPGRNIKRSPAFRGDKLSRTRNLNSPTKEKIVSLVDKNVKLFEDKPEYGKLGRVKKKSEELEAVDEFGIVYDDVDSAIVISKNFGKKDLDLDRNIDWREKLSDGTGYGKVNKLPVRNETSRESRSQSLDRLNSGEMSPAKANERRDSVRTTVISRHKNISSIPGRNDGDNADDDGTTSSRNECRKNDESSYARLDKFLKNGVEYTKVMKAKSNRFDREKTKDELSISNFGDDGIELPDIREELTRRKYRSNEKDERAVRRSRNISDQDRISGLFDTGDNNCGQTKLDFVPVKDIILKTRRDDSALRKSSSFSTEVKDIFENKLTDTLKAALKAPLPSGPPPKKPPRTFAHSPVTNRSPVDDYEEVDGFWQKKKNRSAVEVNCDNLLELGFGPKSEKIRSFLHDVGSKRLANSSDVSEGGKAATRSGESRGEVDRTGEEKLIIPNSNSQLHKIMERTKIATSCNIESRENSSLNSDNLSTSISKLGINTKESIDPSTGERGSFSTSIGRLDESASSEESSVSPLNISYSPQKFKTSPPRSNGCSRSRSRSRSRSSNKDSKEMLDKLEHVLIQHKKASGSKVIVPRSERPDSSVNLASKLTGEGEIETRIGLSRHKEIFHKRLYCTLEEGRKLGPLPDLPDLPDSPERNRNLAFDCLPSLNCAGNSSIYEQIQNPDFKTYLTENSRSNSSERSDNNRKQTNAPPPFADILPQNSQFYLINSPGDDNSFDLINPRSYDTFIVSPTTKRFSKELTTFSDVKKPTTTTTTTTTATIDRSKKEEHVYAEPFIFNKTFDNDIIGSESGNSSPKTGRRFHSNKQEYGPKNSKKGAELHYMCTPIPIACVENNNNNNNDNNNLVNDELTIMKNRQENEKVYLKKSLLKLAILARPSPEKLDKTKIEQLLDQAFGQPVMAGSETPTDSNTSSDTDSLASTTSISDDHAATFSERLQIFKEKEKAFRPSKAELHRSQTDKRKHYVRRVSSRYSDRKEGPQANRADNLFEVCLLVELNLSTKKPYVKDQYPLHAVTPPWIENFCFPDGLDWPPVESDQNLAYTFVLTDEKGDRRYGYCRRVKPEGAPVCLPLAYCLITKHRASGLYAKLLDALESQHGQPDITRRNFIEQLYDSVMPRPGQALRLKPYLEEISEPDDDVVCSATNNNVLVNKFTHTSEKDSTISAAMLNSERLNAPQFLSYSFKESHFYDDQYAIVRLGDHRLEEKDMSLLFDSVSIKVLLILFASLLLERKVVLICDKLSKLSSCVEALQSLLYPFSWPHPFIPFLPNIPEFSEILQAPSPFVIGILRQRNGFGIEVAPLEDGIIVDLDNSKVISTVGDESSILPSRLQKGLKSALQMVSNNTKSGDGFRNFLISEAFLRVFVETCANCDSHICTQQDGKLVFEKESFVKAAPSRGMKYFIEWFVETTMFNQFIQDRLSRLEGSNNPSSIDEMKLFDRRLAEYLKAADKNSQTKRGLNKKKTLGDRFKDLTNFN